MTFRTLKLLVPACAAVFIVGFGAAPVSAAPLQKNAVFDGGHAQVTLVDQRDGRWRGDRGRDRDRGRHWRGRDDRRYWSHSRPYYPRYRPPRYVYAPPVYYDPYYRYYDDYYPPSGYFSYSSPNLGFSFGY
jgi:hypothetical protein